MDDEEDSQHVHTGLLVSLAVAWMLMIWRSGIVVGKDNVLFVLSSASISIPARDIKYITSAIYLHKSLLSSCIFSSFHFGINTTTTTTAIAASSFNSPRFQQKASKDVWW